MSRTPGKSIHKILAAWQAQVRDTNQPQPPAYHGPDLPLTAIVEHTADVIPGACFVARVRETSDGHPYIAKAIERGAALIVGQKAVAELPFLEETDVPYLCVSDSGLAEAWLAAAWEGFPGHELIMIGITGTDGKTTTANILHTLLIENGIRAGLLSTLRAVIGEQEESLALHVTTPESPVVQHFLRRMVDAGMTHCILETTSHGLAQHRVAAIDFDIAVITNITHEHLDYHGSWEAYLAAKARLVHYLDASGANSETRRLSHQGIQKSAILNGDDESSRYLSAIGHHNALIYGLAESADVYATDIKYGADSTRFMLHLPSTTESTRPVQIVSSLVGDFNTYNMLAAAATAFYLGLSPEEVQQGLTHQISLKGRMEPVNAGQPFQVVVDFAHTPNGLAKAIAAGRRMTDGRIITLFGSAGKRDVTKRRLMAEISARDADLTVLTAEDPRTETLSDILEMMAAGCRRMGCVEGQDFWRIPDRGRAIYHALKLAMPGDLVLICGKGHEQSMCFGSTEFPWDDVQATRTALTALKDGESMPNLGLPTF